MQGNKKSTDERFLKSPAVAESRVAPFKFVFGGRRIKVSIFVAATALSLFLYLLLSFFWRGGWEAEGTALSPAIIWGLWAILTPLSGFVLYRNVRGTMREDPALIFDGTDLLVFIDEKQHRCVDSAWYDLTPDERLGRDYVFLNLEPVPSLREIALRGTALKGPGSKGNVGIWSQAFIGDGLDVRTKISDALDELNLRNRGVVR